MQGQHGGIDVGDRGGADIRALRIEFRNDTARFMDCRLKLICGLRNVRERTLTVAVGNLPDGGRCALDIVGCSIQFGERRAGMSKHRPVSRQFGCGRTNIADSAIDIGDVAVRQNLVYAAERLGCACHHLFTALTGGVVDILMLWAGDPDIDRVRLEEALAELIDRFSNVLLEQIDLTDIFQRVFKILRDFHLALPPDLALVLRTLLTAEGFVRRIDPTFDITRELAPLAKELMRERTSPARLRGEANKLLAAFGRAALSTPSFVGQIEKVARTGSIMVSIAPKDLERLRGSERRGEMYAALYPGALAISAAILFSSERRLSALLALISVALAVADRVRRQ